MESADRAGTRVVENPATWLANDFDLGGRGRGVGIVLEPPFALEPGEVDVRWPSGRCFEAAGGLRPAPPDDDARFVPQGRPRDGHDPQSS